MLRELLPDITSAQADLLLEAADNQTDRAIEYYFSGFLNQTKPADPIEGDDDAFMDPRSTGASSSHFAPSKKTGKTNTPIKKGGSVATKKKVTPGRKPRKAKGIVMPCTLITPTKAKCLQIKSTINALEQPSDLLPSHASTISAFTHATEATRPEIDQEAGIYDEIQAVYLQKCIRDENVLVEEIARLKRSHLERV
jgi:hypothetical protein